MTNFGNNQQVASYQENDYLPDQLIAGVFPLTTNSVTVLHSAAVNTVTPLPRGTVMGQITMGTATSAAKAGGNTGAGTFVIDATAPVQANATPGVYKLRVLAAGRAQLLDPKGVSLGEYDYSAGGSVTITDRIKGVLTDDGSTHYAVGDGFDITVAAGSGKWVPSVVTAVDGSQVPAGILTDICNPAAADVVAGIYLTGEFNSNAITFDSGWTVAALTPLLRPFSIFLKSSVSAADPS